MSSTLAWTALLMGLVGGSHCAAMCGPLCAAMGRLGSGSGPRSIWMFQLGRLLSYMLAGAASALAVQSLAWLTSQSGALRPLWTLFHLAVLAWGLMLLAQARQPVWVSQVGVSVWSRLRPLAQRRWGLFSGGALWAFMPCGLLYSALLVASLSGGPLQGAMSMGLFALGSAVWLALAPGLLARLQSAGNAWREGGGTRLAGGLLALVALWALWMDLGTRIAIWCGLDSIA